ncbi:MAG TPA: DUF475 domain-containing protein [Candidatus Paceibacterota bacterium]|nr:DUF475 domain-containing protein [Candidatus Paceibacterota bacterium]
MNPIAKLFVLPVLVSILLLAGVFIWGGFHALALAVLLTILEVTLSFDNAVVNARVLTKMNAKWQQRFLTWGILFAVVITRFVLPIFIVAVSVAMSPWAVAQLAAFDPEHYGELLEGAHYAISSFGGAFLLMVSLKYFFDERKDIHWIRSVERVLARFGRIEALELGLALTLLAVMAFLLPAQSATILFSGIIGIILFIAMQGVANSFTLETGKAVAAGSAALFVYLNVLDAAFSLDGVIGAFAITSQLPVIVAGLGIGAYFVRTLTVFLVRQKTLDTLIYLEHGAHWAILGLAAAMFASLFYQVPEVITGLVGLVFVGAAYWSSLQEQKKAEA